MIADGVSETFELEAENEFRLEVRHGGVVSLMITKGDAELFGRELALNRSYSFSGTKIAIFSWHGTTIVIESSSSVKPDVAYVVTETPMPIYVNAHAVLQQRRKLAKQLGQIGPRCILFAPSLSGATSVARILTGYALKQQKAVLALDLDPKDGSLAIPGGISAGIVEYIDAEDGILCDRPLTMYLGHSELNLSSKSVHIELLKHFVTTLAASVNALFKNHHSQLSYSGFIANAPPITLEKGYELALHMVKELEIDVVFVIGAERLHAQLQRDVPSGVSCVQLPKSGGVVTLDDTFRHKLTSSRIRKYFYGARSELSPYTSVLDVSGPSGVILCRIGSGYQIPDSALPIGAKSTLNALDIEVISVSPTLIHSVLAVSQADVLEEVTEKPVYGFVAVTKVDTDRKQITVLSPSPGKLPGKFLITGSVKWLES
uniref:Protein CLP1 homolog n=1 Tax=Timspurckia oligopyrenoides TaxID=708627 RepID=A0A7S1EUV0_9RHOD